MLKKFNFILFHPILFCIVCIITIGCSNNTKITNLSNLSDLAPVTHLERLKFTKDIIDYRSFHSLKFQCDSMNNKLHSIHNINNIQIDDNDNIDEMLSINPTNNIVNDLRDPYEFSNRGTLKFNNKFNKIVMKPINKLYFTLLPKQILRDMLSNALDNLREPFYILNSFIICDIKNIGMSSFRFLINSTLGMFGMFDFATKYGVIGKKNTFSTTLSFYGMKDGPYVILPFIGPTTHKEALGMLGYIMFDPIGLLQEMKGWYTSYFIKTGLEYIETELKVSKVIDEISLVSLDEYALLRSAYIQSLMTQNEPTNVKRANQ